jgi:gluconokinase
MIIIVMGVTGAGKTTIGVLLATRLGWEFADADDFHSPQNKEKMHRGIPLTDADREPWLQAIGAQIEKWIVENKHAVLACSALKKSYRDEMRTSPKVKFVYLKASYEKIYARLQLRKGHFAGVSILPEQFADLEEPEDALVVDALKTPSEIVEEICRKLHLNEKA